MQWATRWCTKQGMTGPRADGCHQLMYVDGDATLLLHKGKDLTMGIQATERAKGASDMILSEHNFCSIVSTVEKGRTIYSGIQKFVAFIMSVHIAEAMQIFSCIRTGLLIESLAHPQHPFTTQQRQ